MRRVAAWVALCAGTMGAVDRCESGEPAAAVDFAFDVRPILAQRCFRCHGLDEKSVEAGLRLDLRDRAVGELESGNRAIVPGDVTQGELLRRIASEDPDERMPPPEAGTALDPRDVDLLRQWIAEGAVYSDHWSRVAPKRSPLPRVHRPGWAQEHIDPFVLVRLEREGLAPQEEADRFTLVRRLYLDLLGIPPTPVEIEAFASDQRPGAYERLIDRVLAHPAFGERWARVWLDLARYADSAGYAQDPERSIWRYREWVIRALNANLPFDAFTIAQLAGDLLSDPTPDQLIATAFHRNTMTNSEGGTDDEEFRNAAIIDRVNTTMQIWMGVTMECAQCHNHKYDPISQREYFELFAIFNNSADADRADEEPNLAEYSAQQVAERTALERQIADAEQLPEAERPAEQLKAWRAQLAAVQPVKTPVMRELSGTDRRQTHVHQRGNFRKPGDLVEPGVPMRLGGPGDQPVQDRLSLARWLVDRRNPLSSRVAVNRIWEQLFGRGLVETSEDFGTQGAVPTHPRLLDWLACEFMDSGWDTKQLVRTIVLSATYRQSSRAPAELVERDPDNLLLARGPRFRLAAEMLRDQALAVSGLLSTKMLGPSVRPLQPKLDMNASFGGSVDWDPSPGEDRYRRGLYTLWRRTSPYPSMVTFDAPSREFCTIRRIRTNTPLQALVTLNDPAFVEAAQALARRILRHGGSVAERLDWAHRLVLARPPTADELGALSALLIDTESHFRDKLEAATALATDPLGPLPEGVDPKEAASWTVVANVLLNLDETLSRP